MKWMVFLLSFSCIFAYAETSGRTIQDDREFFSSLDSEREKDLIKYIEVKNKNTKLKCKDAPIYIAGKRNQWKEECNKFLTLKNMASLDKELGLSLRGKTKDLEKINTKLTKNITEEKSLVRKNVYDVRDTRWKNLVEGRPAKVSRKGEEIKPEVKGQLAIEEEYTKELYDSFKNFTENRIRTYLAVARFSLPASDYEDLEEKVGQASLKLEEKLKKNSNVKTGALQAFRDLEELMVNGQNGIWTKQELEEKRTALEVKTKATYNKLEGLFTAFSPSVAYNTLVKDAHPLLSQVDQIEKLSGAELDKLHSKLEQKLLGTQKLAQSAKSFLTIKAQDCVEVDHSVYNAQENSSTTGIGITTTISSSQGLSCPTSNFAIHTIKSLCKVNGEFGFYEVSCKINNEKRAPKNIYECSKIGGVESSKRGTPSSPNPSVKRSVGIGSGTST